MKFLLTILAVMSLSSLTHGQSDPRYKQYEGAYGDQNGGIFLFDDGMYYFTTSASFVFGKYTLKNDWLVFKADKPELFYVYANKNTSFGDSTRVNFVNFEETQAFVQFDKEAINRVFNESAACFDKPFVYQRPGTIQDLRLFFTPKDLAAGSLPKNTWHFKNDKGYNDFIITILTPKKEHEDFEARRLSDGQGTRLEISLSGSSSSYQLADTTKWTRKEALQMKDFYLKVKQTEEVCYANKHYRIFLPDLSQYELDPKTMIYNIKTATEGERHYLNNQLNDNRSLRAFKRLRPSEKLQTAIVTNKDMPLIFFSVCGVGREKSYRYNGFIKNDDNNKEEPPVMIMPQQQKQQQP